MCSRSSTAFYVRTGGCCFTNPITVTGILHREEMMIRSRGMGEFVFTAPGVDEALLAKAGFTDICVEDVTPNMERVGRVAWRRTRTSRGGAAQNRRGRNIRIDSRISARRARLWRALERRLWRFVYIVRKPASR